MIWTKAPGDLARCTTQEAAATPAPKADGAPAPEANKQQAAPADKAAPAPKSDQQDIASNEKEEGADLSDLKDKFGDVFTKKDGKCKLDLPWVKLDFECKGDNAGK